MGWFDATFAVALLVLIMSALGSVVGGMASRRLRALDRLQSEANTALFTSNQTLEGTVTARTKELAGTAASLHALIRAAPVGIVQFDTAGAVTSTNDRWRELSGLTDAQTRSTDWWNALLHPADIERVRGAWADCLAGHGPFEGTLRFCLPDGSVNWAKVRTAPLVKEGLAAGHLGSVTDVTALRMAEANALAARELFEAAFASSPLGTAIVSNDGIIVEANQRLGELTGLNDNQIRHRSIDSLFHPVEGSESSSNGAVGVLISTRQRLDRRVKRIDNVETWVKVTVAEISGRNTGSSLYQLEDITARRLAESRVEHLAFHDPLTNLPNRLLLLDRLRQALVHATHRGSGVGVLFLDLDGFKAVNDTQGHQAGDAVLIEVAARIRRGVRASDTVSRIGGDEFVVVCPDMMDMSDIVRIATGLQAAIVQPISIGEKVVSVGSSLGIACGVGHEDPEALLHDADEAMYLAKGRGRARYEVFDDDLRGRIDRRQDTEIALRTAVERGEIDAW